MQLSQKETELLKDLKGQEQLCIEKYGHYARIACSTELKALLEDLCTVEKGHLQSILQLQNGTVREVNGPVKGDNAHCVNAFYKDGESAANDAFICRDMLATEKHASALYDTCVFEFTNPGARKLLNYIQSEEQQHGERLYAYMNANGILA